MLGAKNISKNLCHMLILDEIAYNDHKQKNRNEEEEKPPIVAHR